MFETDPKFDPELFRQALEGETELIEILIVAGPEWRNDPKASETFDVWHEKQRQKVDTSPDPIDKIDSQINLDLALSRIARATGMNEMADELYEQAKLLAAEKAWRIATHTPR